MTSEISDLHHQLEEQVKFLKSFPPAAVADPIAQRILQHIEPHLCGLVAAVETTANILRKQWLTERFAARLADPTFVEELTKRLQEDPVGWDGEPPKETESESESL
jgi:hypothetical protein